MAVLGFGGLATVFTLSGPSSYAVKLVANSQAANDETTILEYLGACAYAVGFHGRLQADETTHALLLELCQRSLHDAIAILPGQRLPDAAGLACQQQVTMMLNCVAQLHSRGVIHQDIKPSNFLLGQDGSIKLCDFNLSRLASDTTRRNGGTVLYFSPNMLNNVDEGYAADWWALGVTLYQALHGLPTWPFSSQPLRKLDLLPPAEQLELVRHAASKAEVRFRPLCGLPRAAKTMIRGLLHPDPHKRWGLLQVLAGDYPGDQAFSAVALRFPQLGHDMERLLVLRRLCRLAPLPRRLRAAEAGEEEEDAVGISEASLGVEEHRKSPGASCHTMRGLSSCLLQRVRLHRKGASLATAAPAAAAAAPAAGAPAPAGRRPHADFDDLPPVDQDPSGAQCSNGPSSGLTTLGTTTTLPMAAHVGHGPGRPTAPYPAGALTPYESPAPGAAAGVVVPRLPWSGRPHTGLPSAVAAPSPPPPGWYGRNTDPAGGWRRYRAAAADAAAGAVARVSAIRRALLPRSAGAIRAAAAHAARVAPRLLVTADGRLTAAPYVPCDLRTHEVDLAVLRDTMAALRRGEMPVAAPGAMGGGEGGLVLAGGGGAGGSGAAAAVARGDGGGQVQGVEVLEEMRVMFERRRITAAHSGSAGGGSRAAGTSGGGCSRFGGVSVGGGSRAGGNSNGGSSRAGGTSGGGTAASSGGGAPGEQRSLVGRLAMLRAAAAMTDTALRPGRPPLAMSSAAATAAAAPGALAFHVKYGGPSESAAVAGTAPTAAAAVDADEVEEMAGAAAAHDRHAMGCSDGGSWVSADSDGGRDVPTRRHCGRGLLAAFNAAASAASSPDSASRRACSGVRRKSLSGGVCSKQGSGAGGGRAALSVGGSGGGEWGFTRTRSVADRDVAGRLVQGAASGTVPPPEVFETADVAGPSRKVRPTSGVCVANVGGGSEGARSALPQRPAGAAASTGFAPSVPCSWDQAAAAVTSVGTVTAWTGKAADVVVAVGAAAVEGDGGEGLGRRRGPNRCVARASAPSLRSARRTEEDALAIVRRVRGGGGSMDAQPWRPRAYGVEGGAAPAAAAVASGPPHGRLAHSDGSLFELQQCSQVDQTAQQHPPQQRPAQYQSCQPPVLSQQDHHHHHLEQPGLGCYPQHPLAHLHHPHDHYHHHHHHYQQSKCQDDHANHHHASDDHLQPGHRGNHFPAVGSDCRSQASMKAMGFRGGDGGGDRLPEQGSYGGCVSGGSSDPLDPDPLDPEPRVTSRGSGVLECCSADEAGSMFSLPMSWALTETPAGLLPAGADAVAASASAAGGSLRSSFSASAFQLAAAMGAAVPTPYGSLTSREGLLRSARSAGRMTALRWSLSARSETSRPGRLGGRYPYPAFSEGSEEGESGEVEAAEEVLRHQPVVVPASIPAAAAAPVAQAAVATGALRDERREPGRPVQEGEGEEEERPSWGSGWADGGGAGGSRLWLRNGAAVAGSSRGASPGRPLES